MAANLDPSLAQTVVDSVADPMLLVDARGCLRAANAAAPRVWGYTADELKHVGLAQLVPLPFGGLTQDDPAALAERMTIAAELDYEAQGRRKQGTVFPLWLAIEPIGVEGQTWYTVAARDLTRRKALEARHVQEQRLAAIRELSSGLAHESRNALQRSQSCLELLAFETRDRAKAQELIERIQKAQDHLLELYEEVRSYAAPVKLVIERVALDELLLAAWSEVRGANAESAPQLRIAPDNVDPWLQADRDRIVHLLQQLLKNAVQSVDNGGAVTVSWRASDIGGREAVTLSVCDTGAGVAAEVIPKLFRPFCTNRTRGMGLGLAISKRIAEAHGGRIDYVPTTAELGHAIGARFDITLPRQTLGV